MAGIKISKELKNRLPADEREGLEEFLWSKTGTDHRCFLCEEPMNRASDTIEADHNTPVAEGGIETRDNLYLAHLSCNRAKRNSPSVDIRPYLRIAVYLRKHEFPQYDGCLDFFDIDPKPTVLTTRNGWAKFEFPNGAMAEVPIFTESNQAGSFDAVFVQVPRNAIFNDGECQPRRIKLHQLWAIYQDIQQNPLHEPPSLRVVRDGSRDTCRLAMFDGQHKTLAAWLANRNDVIAKVYLNINKDQTVRLVNSIQAKIKKLPLSPFELASKLSEEWAARLTQYENEVGDDAASEAGFFKWLEPGERTRFKQAFEAALVQDILSSGDLQMKKYVHLSGGGKSENSLITENVFRKKLLETLLHLKPLDIPASDSELARSRERDNLIRALNYLCELAFDPQPGEDVISGHDAERRRRMAYQSALSYVATLIRRLFGHVLALEESDALIGKAPSEEQWGKLRQGIQRLVDHPVWVADWDETQKMRAIRDALTKNQEAAKAFGNVGLKLGYLVGADKLPHDWNLP